MQHDFSMGVEECKWNRYINDDGITGAKKKKQLKLGIHTLATIADWLAHH